VERKREIASLFNPYMFIRNDPILPNTKNAISPINGEKITGKSTGRLVTCLIVVKGLNVRPRRVFVQMYAQKIKNVLFFIVLRFFSGL